MRLCSVTAHLKCNHSFPRHLWMWINVHMCQFMRWPTKLEFSEPICFLFFSVRFPVLETCVKKKLNFGRSHPLIIIQCSNVHTHQSWSLCVFLFLRSTLEVMWFCTCDVLSQMRLFFLFCLFWHFLKHDRSQECKISPPVSWGDAHMRCPCCCCICRGCTWTRQ